MSLLREWRFRSRWGTDLVVRSWMTKGEPWPLRAEPISAARASSEVGGWFRERETHALAKLAEMYSEVAGTFCPPMGWREDDWHRSLLPALVHAFAMGTLEAREVPRPVFSGPQAWTKTPEAAAAEEAPPEPTKAALTIELLNAKGEPMTGQRFVLRLPDGTRETGKLNASGRVRFPEAPLGTAVLSFPKEPPTANSAQ